LISLFAAQRKGIDATGDSGDWPDVLDKAWDDHRDGFVDLLDGSVIAGAALLAGQIDDPTKLPDDATKKLAFGRADAAIANVDATTLKRLADDADPFPDGRATTIATTETAGAFNAGMKAVALATGGFLKEWIAQEGCCDDCAELAEADPIELDDTWDTDDGPIDEPPRHPNCLCALGFVIAP
jgi:hypothetical protein